MSGWRSEASGARSAAAVRSATLNASPSQIFRGSGLVCDFFERGFGDREAPFHVARVGHAVALGNHAASQWKGCAVNTPLQRTRISGEHAGQIAALVDQHGKQGRAYRRSHLLIETVLQCQRLGALVRLSGIERWIRKSGFQAIDDVR